MIEQLRYEHYCNAHNKCIAFLLAKLYRRKIYFPCLEVPITTLCTLCCKNCSNLMQFYEHPYHIPSTSVISNLSAILKAINGVDCLRILGGEPLLAPELVEILRFCKDNDKIKNIVIVTNGTMTFADECIKLICDNTKFKVLISNYNDNSYKLNELEDQLKNARVQYRKNNIQWKEKANLTYRYKKTKDLKKTFANCPNRFFSLLNNELHICPRSSHGADLGVFAKKRVDYVDLTMATTENLRHRIVSLLKTSYLQACNYCDEDVADSLKVVQPGIQCKRTESVQLFKSILIKNEQIIRRTKL